MAARSLVLHFKRGKQGFFCQQLLWTGRECLLNQELLGRHALWWGNSQDKNCSCPPDSLYKPTWVDAELVPLDLKMGEPNCSLPDDSDPRMPARLERWVTAETVGKLCQQGRLVEAVEALGVLVRTECRISQSLLCAVLGACVRKKDLALCRRIHVFAVKRGFGSDTFFCNQILRMYASHARLQEAMDVFTMVVKPDAFTWSSIITAHVKQGKAEQAVQLYHQMRKSSVKPDGHVFVAALQACARAADLSSGQQVHADVSASGTEGDLFVSNGLVDMYAKCGSMEDAERIFHGLHQKDVVTWNAMISGCSQQGKGQEALGLFNAMQEQGFPAPNSVTFVCILQACASVGVMARENGKQLHAQIKERGLERDVSVGNNLINMYAKCGSLEDAWSVFDGLHQKDVVTWNTMFAGYVQQGRGHEALLLASAMQRDRSVAATSVTFVCLLQACASVGVSAIEMGKQLHAEIEEQGLQADATVGNNLINMYAKCGSLEDAQRVFDGLGRKDVVTWTALIAGYSQQGMGHEALRVYSAMRKESVIPPDLVTFLCLLQACSNAAALLPGKQLHSEIEEQGLQADVSLAVSLINMYAKSGSMFDALKVFHALPARDIVTWNALIAGYTYQGDTEVVFELVHRMRGDGIQPDAITFLSVLTVCSHAGLVNKGQEYFEAMTRHYGINPTVEHYSCMVDLLGRAGELDEALAMAKSMPVPPDVAVWRALLGACQKWSNVEVGRHAFDEALKLDKQDAGTHVLMSNIYISAQLWEKAEEMQAMRLRSGAWKQPGQSWWTDLDGLVHSFVVEDTQHCGSEEYTPS